jgi:homopolymeric O-antigen transport system permease protein
MLLALRNLNTYRHLLVELTKRELFDRYSQQVIGALWAWAHPLILMLIYTAVFNTIFAVRFADQAKLPRDFISYALAGIVPLLALQDVLARSADTVVGHAGFVKQMAFPLEVLPVKRALSSLAILFSGVAFLVLYQLYTFGSLPWTILLWPLWLACFVLFSCGVVFFFGALGVFIRDLREIITVFLAANLYLAPVIFVPGMTPSFLEKIFWLNPTSFVFWMHQDIIFYGRIEHPIAWLVFPVLSVAAFTLGLRFFQHVRPQFGEAL